MEAFFFIRSSASVLLGATGRSCVIKEGIVTFLTRLNSRGRASECIKRDKAIREQFEVFLRVPADDP